MSPGVGKIETPGPCPLVAGAKVLHESTFMRRVVGEQLAALGQRQSGRAWRSPLQGAEVRADSLSPQGTLSVQ